MLKFHNGSANLANLVLFFSRKDAKFANFSANHSNLHVSFLFLASNFRSLLSVVRSQARKIRVDT